jgi:hypothetical protein
MPGGNTPVVTKLDRLTRCSCDARNTVEEVTANGGNILSSTDTLSLPVLASTLGRSCPRPARTQRSRHHRTDVRCNLGGP